MDKPRKPIDLPWPAIAAALLAVGGVFLYLNPLQTSRPTQAGFPVRFNRNLQDVEARLWQDPLRTTAEHETQVQSQKDVSAENSLHAVGALRERLRWPDSSSSLVLAVMIQGGSYAEYSESRLRMRQAVLEALGAQSYVPRDGEHIGYFKIDKPEWDWRSMIVPFEWCERNVHKAGENSSSFELPDRICVLWLRDEEFQDQPLSRLDWLLCNFDALGVDTANVKTRVIGPRTSTTLLAMMREVAVDEQSLDRLPQVEIWCATATASDELLLHEINQAENQMIEEYFAEKTGSAEDNECFIFHRCTPTDRDVINTLANELRTKRHMDVSDDHIALISEWDTFYGRALPTTFEREVSGMALNQLLEGQHPQNILIYHYLRGIDGMLPGTSAGEGAKTEEKKGQTEEKKQSSVAREMTVGLNQADYLRRLARELADRNEEFRRKGKREIKAVGVLGSDVYDKLLVMEALRDALPNAIFFTNQLDSRLAHPDEWRWTRNLLVGSPFGLTLREEYQDVPPFRESDQTAFYTATLLAAGHPARAEFLKSRDVLRPVRLYEIGRKGAFDLTPRSTSPKTLQPENFDMERWWNRGRKRLTLAIGLFALAAIAWSLRIIVGHPNLSRDLKRYRREPLAGSPSQRTRWLRRALVVTRWRFFRADRSVARALGSSWNMFVILGLCSMVLVWWISGHNASEGEPYSWSDGISIWPTETLRLFAFLLSAFYLWKINKALWESERRVECNFALPKYSHFLARLSPEKSWWRRLIAPVTVRHWKCDKDNTIDASLLWTCYCDSGTLRARCFRIAPLIVCYIGAATCLLLLLGAPGVPARGDWARNWDRIFLVLAILGSVSVTFYVADVTLLCRRFIHYLMKDVTTWPPGALTNLRGRWSRSEGAPVAAEEIQIISLQGKIPPNDLLGSTSISISLPAEPTSWDA